MEKVKGVLMKKLLIAASVLLATVVGFVVVDSIFNPARAADCSANSVAKCGVWSVAEMRNAYNNDTTPGLRNIFNGMGLTSDIVNKSTVKEGVTTKSGLVIVDGKTVATGATSAGRLVHSARYTTHTYGGTKYYVSANADAFLSDNLAVYVFFDKNGIFQGAVIKDCGNPLKANPVKPTPKPAPPAEKTIEVCRLKDKKYPVEIKESEFDKNKYSKNPEDCKTPGVSITKKVDGVDHKAVETGVEFTYQIRVLNTGETDLKNVVVKDDAEEGVEFIGSSHGTVTTRSWTYTIDELKKGEHQDFTISAEVPEYQAGKIKNTVCVDAPSVPGNPDDCDDATVEVPKPAEMIVCVIEEKEYPVTIRKEEFNSNLHSTDPRDCEEEEPVAPPVAPAELPKTGVGDSLMNVLGVGSLTTAVLAYGASRRF